MDHNPQESLENTMNTMGTLLGVHPIVPWWMSLNLEIPAKKFQPPGWGSHIGHMVQYKSKV